MSIDVAYAPKINEWQGQTSVQLSLEEWEIRPDNRERNWDVFPKLDAESPLKLVDRRGTNKKSYLLKLLTREESCIIYVQDEEMLDTLLAHVLPEGIEGIARHTAAATASEETALLKQVESGEIRTIASSGTFARHNELPFVKHIVFCHPTPNEDLFFSRCRTAFATDETTYLHLIYGDKEVTETHNWVASTYPTHDELKHLYRNLRDLLRANGTDGYPEAKILKSGLGTLSRLQTTLAIFEEMRLIGRQGEPGSERITLLASQNSEISQSQTYLRGAWIRQTGRSFIELQIKESIESMWERIENEHKILNQPNSNV